MDPVLQHIHSTYGGHTGNCAGNAATKLFTEDIPRSVVLIHNAKSTGYDIWVQFVNNGATAPTITEGSKIATVSPGDTMPFQAGIGLDIYIQNSSGSASTQPFSALQGDPLCSAAGHGARRFGAR